MHTSQSSGRAAACVFCTSLQLSKELKFWLDNRNSEKGKVLNVGTIIDPVGFLQYILRSPNYLKKNRNNFYRHSFLRYLRFKLIC